MDAVRQLRFREPFRQVRGASGLLLALFVAVGCQPSPPTDSSATPSAPADGSTPTAPADGSSPVTVPTGALVDADGARAALERFVGTPIDVQVSGPERGAAGPFFQLQGPGLSAAVDVGTGRLLSVLFLDKMPTSRTTTLTAADAEAAARDFVTAHGVAIDGLTPTTVLEDHGDTVDYAVTWTKMDRGIELPVSTLVRVDAASGTVFSFGDLRRPYATPPDPTLTRDDAVRLATTVAAIGSPVVESARLRVTFAADGTQRLVWEIGLGQPASLAHVLVEVDAISGDARVIGRG